MTYRVACIKSLTFLAQRKFLEIRCLSSSKVFLGFILTPCWVFVFRWDSSVRSSLLSSMNTNTSLPWLTLPQPSQESSGDFVGPSVTLNNGKCWLSIARANPYLAQYYSYYLVFINCTLSEAVQIYTLRRCLPLKFLTFVVFGRSSQYMYLSWHFVAHN